MKEGTARWNKKGRYVVMEHFRWEDGLLAFGDTIGGCRYIITCMSHGYIAVDMEDVIMLPSFIKWLYFSKSR